MTVHPLVWILVQAVGGASLGFTLGAAAKAAWRRLKEAQT